MAKHGGPHLTTLNYGISLHQAGDIEGAAKVYRDVLRQVPRESSALRLLGVVELQRSNLDEAEKHLSRALKINPGSADTHYFMGRVFWDRKRSDRAIFHLNRCIELDPGHVPALVSLGCAMQEKGDPNAAIALFERALTFNPNAADAWYNLGRACQQLGQPERALACYDRSIQASPRAPDTHAARGHLLAAMRDHEGAAACFERTVALKPDFAEAHEWLGDALAELRYFDGALAAYDRALAVNPKLANVSDARASVLRQMQRYPEAAAAAAQTLAIAPDHDYALGELVYSKLLGCDWGNLDALCAQMIKAVRDGKRAAKPFVVLGVPGAADAELAAAKTFVADQAPPRPFIASSGRPAEHQRLRIAYVSSDLYDHATSYLMAGLFESHDRSRFETFGISFGPDQGTMRPRLIRAFDHFHDVRAQTDQATAELLRNAEIDIAVDLKGFTQGARPNIFAYRAAPLQVNYLGFPGTLGADYIDYIVADRWVIPDDHHGRYTENIVTLPDSYQVNDSKRPIADICPTRAEAGLPEKGFVFCCFNNSFKIVPEVFDAWMGLLRDVEGSALWLYDGGAATAENLRRAAGERGIAPERLVFAPTMRNDQHLARHRLADLFLDTLPYNAHTTASDALWAGLPMITCMGATFAGRVATSLLNAVGLPELVTHSLGDYQALALKLARDPAALADLKARLALNRLSAPLFQTDRFRRHIETAYEEMWARHQRGEPPASFAVAPVA
jgi:predicted O-linked N-acetylglucosamine transferase (SPINDLY family)